MGRSKQGFLDRGEQKRIKAGKLSLINHSEPKQTNYLITSLRGKHTAAPEYFNKNARHAVVEERVRAGLARVRPTEGRASIVGGSFGAHGLTSTEVEGTTGVVGGGVAVLWSCG